MFVVGHQVSAKVGSGLSRGSPGVLVQTGSKQNGVGNEVVRKVVYQFGVGLLSRKRVEAPALRLISDYGAEFLKEIGAAVREVPANPLFRGQKCSSGMRMLFTLNDSLGNPLKSE